MKTQPILMSTSILPLPFISSFIFSHFALNCQTVVDWRCVGGGQQGQAVLAVADWRFRPYKGKLLDFLQSFGNYSFVFGVEQSLTRISCWEQMKETAEGHLGHPVNDAVITVPACESTFLAFNLRVA